LGNDKDKKEEIQVIKANSNAVQYGVKHLVFDDNDQFKAYTGVAAIGSTAYIIKTKKAYILDSTNTWQPLPTWGSGSGSGGSSGGGGHEYPVDGDGGDIDEDVEVIYIYDGGEIK
jgi:hypothetical protein